MIFWFKNHIQCLKKENKSIYWLILNFIFWESIFSVVLCCSGHFFHFPHFWKSPALWHRQFVPHKLHLHEELKQQSPGLWSQLLPRRMQLLLFRVKKVYNKKMLENVLCKYKCFSIIKKLYMHIQDFRKLPLQNKNFMQPMKMNYFCIENQVRNPLIQ